MLDLLSAVSCHCCFPRPLSMSRIDISEQVCYAWATAYLGQQDLCIRVQALASWTVPADPICLEISNTVSCCAKEKERGSDMQLGILSMT